MKPDGWNPSQRYHRITAVDAHTAGEPFRVITGGIPPIPGATMLERRRYARENLDHLRRALMWEPRGHADMYGCLITPPATAGADLGVLFLHNEGYSSMCGHGIIGLATVLLETGMHPMTETETVLRIDTPAGVVEAHARITEQRVQSVYFYNVPSFVFALDQKIEVAGLGEVCYDLAFGGAFYAYVQAQAVGLDCTPEQFHVLIEKGMAIKRAVMANRPVPHPFEPDLSFLYGTIFIGPARSEDAHSRNVCIFADGEVDRSPTGTGVSGRLAIHYARGELGLEQPIVIESILGSRFSGWISAENRFGPYAAIVPVVEGSAFITGRHEFLIDPHDELRHGFILR
jgi:trans-L-3-hydroxyproline dehydratase